MLQSINFLSEKIERLFTGKRAFWIVVFFAIWYGLISFVNHYLFRTSSDPTGIYTNAIYDYAHFRANDCKLLTPLNAELETPFFDNKLSDHFNLIQFVFAPFYLLFGSYTLLIFQWLAVLLGGWGVFRYFNEFHNQKALGGLAMFHYFAFFGFHSAFAFDYHDNVVGASVVPWLFYFLRKGNIKWFSILVILAVSCKENIPIFLFFIFMVLAIKPFEKSKKQQLMALIAGVFCVAYFLMVTKMVMPALANEGRDTYLHFHYSALGESYGEAIKYALSHPIETFKLFFVNHTGSSWGDGIKTELYCILLISGAFAWFFKPRWLLMAIPIIAQKVFNDQTLKWGINYHYNAEVVALVTFGLFHFIGSMAWRRLGRWIAYLLVISTFSITIVKYQSRTAVWYSEDKQNLFMAAHYSRAFDVKETYRALQLIPKDENVSVSAHYALVPHLAIRKDIYEFPIVEDAEYIAVLIGEGTYPLKTNEAFADSVAVYRNSPEWELLYDQNKMQVLRRIRKPE